MIEKSHSAACAEALARLLVSQISRNQRRRSAGPAIVRPHAVPSFGSRRRDSLEGYVVCLELGEATILAEGGQFAFQVPANDLTTGQRVRFVREGDRFEVV